MGNLDVRMKADHGKTTATTEAVSSHPGEKGHCSQKWRRNSPVPENNRNELEEYSCKPVEQEEDHEKGPRWSWARNQMGNPDSNRVVALIVHSGATIKDNLVARR
jgi:hypothetical protein